MAVYIHCADTGQIGDEHGLRFLLDICKPDRPVKGLHHPVPVTTPRSRMDGESVSPGLSIATPFLSKETSSELIRCFFHYVHPVLPILDAATFLHAYEFEWQRTIPDLLLWSVYFVGASVCYIPERIVPSAVLTLLVYL